MLKLYAALICTEKTFAHKASCSPKDRRNILAQIHAQLFNSSDDFGQNYICMLCTEICITNSDNVSYIIQTQPTINKMLQKLEKITLFSVLLSVCVPTNCLNSYWLAIFK